MEKREETSSAHKRSASLSSPQNMGAKRKPEPEDMTPGAQGKKPKDKNQNGLPLAQKLLQDFRINGEDAEEDVKVDVEQGRTSLNKNPSRSWSFLAPIILPELELELWALNFFIELELELTSS